MRHTPPRAPRHPTGWGDGSGGDDWLTESCACCCQSELRIKLTVFITSTAHREEAKWADWNVYSNIWKIIKSEGWRQKMSFYFNRSNCIWCDRRWWGMALLYQSIHHIYVFSFPLMAEWVMMPLIHSFFQGPIDTYDGLTSSRRDTIYTYRFYVFSDISEEGLWQWKRHAVHLAAWIKYWFFYDVRKAEPLMWNIQQIFLVALGLGWAGLNTIWSIFISNGQCRKCKYHEGKQIWKYPKENKTKSCKTSSRH